MRAGRQAWRRRSSIPRTQPTPHPQPGRFPLPLPRPSTAAGKRKWEAIKKPARGPIRKRDPAQCDVDVPGLHQFAMFSEGCRSGPMLLSRPGRTLRCGPVCTTTSTAAEQGTASSSAANSSAVMVHLGLRRSGLPFLAQKERYRPTQPPQTLPTNSDLTANSTEPVATPTISAQPQVGINPSP
jgi:hypothetical protein